MTNYKKKFITELELEIQNTANHITHLENQINLFIPKSIQECNLKIKNLYELLENVKNNDSFTDPIFSYCNNEGQYV
jgi:hypothetical protein